MPNHRLIVRFIAVMAVVMVSGLVTARAAEPGATKPAGAAGSPAKFAAKTATCREYLALAPNLRGLVVAWTAGRFYQSKAADTWLLDETSATKVLATVDDECGKAPEASFRYKVVAAVKKR